eukprot:g503.t1
MIKGIPRCHADLSVRSKTFKHVAPGDFDAPDWPELRKSKQMIIDGYVQAHGYTDGHEQQVLADRIAFSDSARRDCDGKARQGVLPGRKLLTMHWRGGDYGRKLNIVPHVPTIVATVRKLHDTHPLCVTIVSDSPFEVNTKIVPQLQQITGCVHTLCTTPLEDMCIAGSGDFIVLGAGSFSYFAAFFRRDYDTPVFFDPHLWRWRLTDTHNSSGATGKFAEKKSGSIVTDKGLAQEHNFYPPSWHAMRPFPKAGDIVYTSKYF